MYPRSVAAKGAVEGHERVVQVDERVHNHPRGDPETSPDGRDLARRLLAVGELVGIRAPDHIAVGDGSYVSFVERGWIQP
jgi:DNA repair protein RadC